MPSVTSGVNPDCDLNATVMRPFVCVKSTDAKIPHIVAAFRYVPVHNGTVPFDAAAARIFPALVVAAFDVAAVASVSHIT